MAEEAPTQKGIAVFRSDTGNSILENLPADLQRTNTNCTDCTVEPSVGVAIPAPITYDVLIVAAFLMFRIGIKELLRR